MSTYAARMASLDQQKGKPNLSREDRRELLRSVAAVYEGKCRGYPTLRNVERTPISELRAMSTSGTALRPAAAYLMQAGLITGDTVGEVMDALGIEQHQLDRMACFCDHGERVSSKCIAQHLRSLARSSLVEKMASFAIGAWNSIRHSTTWTPQAI